MTRRESLSSGMAGARGVLQLVGLARRAGYAIVGTQAVREAARRGNVRVVVVAEDATENALRRIGSLLREPDVEVVRCGTRNGLGQAVGRQEAVVVGISDSGMGSRIVVEGGRPDVEASPSPVGVNDGPTDTE